MEIEVVPRVRAPSLVVEVVESVTVPKRRCEWCRRVPKKRWFLPLSLVVPACVFPFDFHDYTITACIAFSSFLLVWNFPGVAIFWNRRPLYYEDLEDSRPGMGFSEPFRQRFQKRFMIFQQVGVILAATIIFDYTTHRIEDHQTPIEIIGIIGGLMSLYTSIVSLIGKVWLKFLFYRKRKQEESHLSP